MVGAASLSVVPSTVAPAGGPAYPIVEPSGSSGVVPRPRLYAWLEQAVRSQVVVITAAAGTGKTSLLAGWAETRAPGRTMWLGNPGTGTSPGMEAAARWLEPQLHRATATEDAPRVLVVDDVHDMDPACADRLEQVIRALGPGRSVVLAGRSLGPMSMVDLGLAAHVTRLAACELRFDAGEARELLGSPVAARLGEPGVERVMALTEGWAAGLKLAGLCFEDGGNGTAAWSEETLVSLSGRYLDREVLDGTASEDLDLLARTAVTDRLVAGNAEAVTGRPDAWRLLESMVEEHRMIERGDDGSYRYHPLMAEHLRRRLVSGDRRAAGAVHSAMADWMAAHGDVPGAVEHLLRAGAEERALTLAASSMIAHLTGGPGPGPGPSAGPSAGPGAGPGTGTGGAADLPGHVPTPFLMAERTRMYPVVVSLLAQWRLGEASAWLRCFESGLGDGRDHVADRIRAEWLWALHDSIGMYPEGVLAHWHRSAALPPSDPGDAGPSRPAWLLPLDEAVAAAARWAAARAGAEMGQPDAARVLLGENLHLEQQPHGPLALGPLAAVALAGGRLGPAGDLAVRAIEVSGSLPIPALDGHLTLAAVHLERDELPEARRQAAHAHRLAVAAGSVTWTAAADLVTARLEISDGSARRALGLLDSVRAAHRSHLPPSLLDALSRAEFRARLILGDVNGARDVLEAIEPAGRPRNAVARLHLSAGRPDRAAADLNRAAAQPAMPRDEMERLLLHARANLQLGAIRAAEHSLQRALELGRREGFIRVFLEEPPQVIDALRSLRTHRPDGYVDEILARADGVGDGNGNGAGARHEAGGGGLHGASILEPLTDRERELVMFLPSHLTQHEIARQMYISANTVKTHMKGLYRKLGATSRSEAVDLARACGLL